MKNLLTLLTLLSLSLIYSSCTKKFDDMNTDYSKIPDIGPQEIPYLFSKAQSLASPASYQTYQNLYPDLYAQYFATTSTGFQTDRYFIRFDWLDNNWTNQFTGMMPQLVAIMQNTDPSSEEYALASIWWVFAFHHITDYWGPIPYFQLGNQDDLVPAYDPMDRIYDDFFKRLDEAVTVLKASDRGTVFKGYDLLFDGDLQKWITFANTLRLRLALRISNIDPQRARTEAEAAVASGVMMTTTDNAAMTKSLSGNDYNPLSHIAVWNEFSMSAAMLSYLKGYSDPRMAVYFQPAVSSNEFEGLRNGQSTTDLNKPENQPNANSQIGPGWISRSGTGWLVENPTRSQEIMSCAEAYFLRAEGALNGWNMNGSAQELYENGIRMSMEQWGIDPDSVQNYIHSDAVPVAVTGAIESPAVSNTPIKWAGDIQMQRQQIGTQKWIALYPDGFEAWAEVRRSGFPILYPVVQSDNADLPAGTTIKRLPYPNVEAQTDAEELAKGRTLLGGPDNAATPLWWDVD